MSSFIFYRFWTIPSQPWLLRGVRNLHAAMEFACPLAVALLGMPGAVKGRMLQHCNKIWAFTDALPLLVAILWSPYQVIMVISGARQQTGLCKGCIDQRDWTNLLVV